MNDTILYAREYIKSGWHVLPVEGKVPLTKNGLKDATSDPQDIEMWWGVAGKWQDSGIAVRTGAISGIVVVDVDAKSGGLDSFRDLVDQGLLPLTATVLTGGGGLHLYYAHPGGEIKNSASKIAPGIDIRGDNGYVVAPPSGHASGGTYQWELAPSATPLASFPISLLPQDTTFKAEDLRVSGKRNTSLTSLVGYHVRKGLPKDSSLAVARQESTLPDSEIVSIVERAYDTWTREFPHTDIGQAELISQLSPDVCYDLRQEKFLKWDGMHWRKADTVYGTIKDGARFTGAKAEKAVEEAKLSGDVGEKKAADKYISFAQVLESARGVNSVTDMLKEETTKNLELDAHEYLLGVKNGVVNLTDGTLRAGHPDDWITKTTAYPYDPTATCPRWEQFVVEITRDPDGNNRPDLAEFFWRAVGYSATGEVSKQCWFLCLGTGSNGKGTFLGTIKAVLGEYAQAMSVKTITVRGNRRSTDDDVADLAGARFLLSGEAGISAELDSERIKLLVGSDTDVRASRIYRGDIEFHMQGKMWMPNNREPRVNDDSHGFWRRLYLLPFDQQFPVDATIQRILEQERVGILTWIIRGAKEYIDNGLNPPAIVIARTGEMRNDNDPFSEWVSTCLVEDPAGKLTGKEAQDSYTSWCHDESIPEKLRSGPRRLGEYLMTKYRRKHGETGNYYQGVRPKNENDGQNIPGGSSEVRETEGVLSGSVR